MDTNVVPLGERILRSVLDHVVANGHAAETSYLEAKSTVDITSKPGLVKVALSGKDDHGEDADRDGFAESVAAGGP